MRTLGVSVGSVPAPAAGWQSANEAAARLVSTSTSPSRPLLLTCGPMRGGGRRRAKHFPAAPPRQTSTSTPIAESKRGSQSSLPTGVAGGGGGARGGSGGGGGAGGVLIAGSERESRTPGSWAARRDARLACEPTVFSSLSTRLPLPHCSMAPISPSSADVRFASPPTPTSPLPVVSPM